MTNLKQLAMKRKNPFLLVISELRHEKTCSMPYANNKDAGQLVHLRSLISFFVVRSRDRIIHIHAKSIITRLQLVSVAEQVGSRLPGRKPPKTGFLVM